MLAPHREKPVGSVEFIVEGTKHNPIIGIRYPGNKLIKRTFKKIRANSVLYANLFDFIVIPYINDVGVGESEFTYEKVLKDFQENKRDNEKFWNLIESLYHTNEISEDIPKLEGINSKLFLLVLKWLWIQEDFNYRFGWEEVGSPIRYVLETRTGSRTAKGAGRAKFFAALILVKHYFTFEQVKKIISLY